MTVRIKLRPMREAPKDREIFALYTMSDRLTPHPGNFHPIQWIECPWDENFVPRWGMRWSTEFRATLGNYVGWFDPQELSHCETPK